MPALAEAADAIAERLGMLAAALREVGVRVGIGELVTAHRALAAIDAAARRESYLGLRAVLCSSREDARAFDLAFAAVFGEPGESPPRDQPVLPPGAELALPRAAVPGGRAPRPGEEPVVRPAAYSDVELLRHKDFAQYTDAERALARAVLRRLARRGPRRRSRRTRATRRRGVRPDLQRTLRAALRHGGEPLERRWREHGTRARPLVLLCDVSGSMEPYSRMLLQYLHAAVAARKRVEAFAFGTRLTRLTRELRERDPDRALARASAAVEDFAGGTRIGAAVAELNREHGRRVGRGAIVVILSDGWDRGEPELLAREMAWLRRSAYRVIWLNPLKAGAGYEPLARGMAAALPHTDRFLAGHSLASLEELAELLEDGI
ncbi:MAG TPA: VWA domain-containing protein [Solirubrobacteraceae bacterium]|nr:VWA domain-containing protein [Solirubrobacteraceae bacterium]